ncbi:MAG: hypothetical protein Q7K37_05905 [Dehalococcoidia bacterium]|nr:hypothetical protein [Dehalococcoidia bacterium]
MRIGLDFDDTLADFSALLVELVAARFGFDLRAMHAEGKPGRPLAGAERWDAMILEMLETDLTLAMPPKPDAVEIAQRLAERHELVVLTSRYDREMPFLHAWLDQHGIRTTDVLWTNRESKAPPARQHGLGVLFDDTARNFEDFVEHPTVPALFLGAAVSPRAPEYGAHVRAISHWREFEVLVEALEAGNPAPDAVIRPATGAAGA